MNIVCKNCGQDLPGNSTICTNCANPVAGASPPPKPMPPQSNPAQPQTPVQPIPPQPNPVQPQPPVQSAPLPRQNAPQAYNSQGSPKKKQFSTRDAAICIVVGAVGIVMAFLTYFIFLNEVRTLFHQFEFGGGCTRCNNLTLLLLFSIACIIFGCIYLIIGLVKYKKSN